MSTNQFEAHPLLKLCPEFACDRTVTNFHLLQNQSRLLSKTTTIVFSDKIVIATQPLPLETQKWKQQSGMRVAVEGWTHGWTLEKIYETIPFIEARVNLLSCCGNAEEISRSLYILQVSSSSPHATLTILIQFADNDEKVGPVLVIFTRGNHESAKRWLGGAEHLLHWLRRRRHILRYSNRRTVGHFRRTRLSTVEEIEAVVLVLTTFALRILCDNSPRWEWQRSIALVMVCRGDDSCKFSKSKQTTTTAIATQWIEWRFRVVDHFEHETFWLTSNRIRSSCHRHWTRPFDSISVRRPRNRT